jgi:hypothetical protein
LVILCWLARESAGRDSGLAAVKEVAPNDARLVTRTLQRVEQSLAVMWRPWPLTGDLIANITNSGLTERKTYNAICPRSVNQLKQRKRSWKFTSLQRRRSQCEGRIGIVKNNFLASHYAAKASPAGNGP